MNDATLPGRDDRCGNYRLLECIGRGGMGAVYRAVHPEIGRIVAIKVLRPELAASEEAIARFFDEARAVNAIRHEGIVDIFDLGRRSDGSTYFVMEHLAGEDLSQLVRREGALPAHEAVPLVVQVAAALTAAHRRNIVHRDLKPQNLFVITRGAERRIKLLDFGIAKLMGELAERPNTSTGVVLGTIPYMAPEQARGEAVDARADIYSLGCILFELLTGQVPFAAKNPLAILARLATEEPVAPSVRSYRFGVPPALDAIVLRALAKERDTRYSDIEELKADLAGLDLSVLPAPTPSPAAPVIGEPLAPTLPHGEAPTAPQELTPQPAALATPSPGGPRPTPRSERPPAQVRPDPLSAMAERPLDDSTRRLRETESPLIDPSTERRVIRIVIPILLMICLLGLGMYYAKGTGPLDHEVLGRWLPWLGAAATGLAALLVLVERTQQSSSARTWVNRAVTLLAVAMITTSIYLKGALTSYDLLYYPALVILDRLRADRALGRFTLFSSILGYSATVLTAHFALLPYAPLYPGRVSPELSGDLGLAGVTLLVMAGISTLSLLLVDQLANRVQRRERELRELGLSLTGRLEEQLELLRRSADLRRYLPPALADAILRGEADSTRHTRRRLTVVRVDCPAIAAAVDDTDPEEFAHLLNSLYAKLADRATEQGGVVDRFGDAGALVLFGTMVTGEVGPENAGAQEAIAFARAALSAIATLEPACRGAGIVAAPVGRAAIHQGFATLGSFGSPTRLEFSAVGPTIEAARELQSRAALGTVVITQPVEASLHDEVARRALGEPVPLPGARHPVRLFTLG